jgi:hypothetical protein
MNLSSKQSEKSIASDCNRSGSFKSILAEHINIKGLASL